MKTQRILYNQLNLAYIYEDIDDVFGMYVSGDIRTGTSAGTISLHIYSKVISYAANKDFFEDKESEYIHCKNRKQGILKHSKETGSQHIVVMDSCEPYISKKLHNLKTVLEKEEIILDIRENSQFLISNQKFKEKYPTPPVMETFYRRMRKEHGILMEDQKPTGGKRNYDKENRKFDRNFTDADHIQFGHNTYREEAKTIYAQDIQKRGKLLTRYFPVTREEALGLLDHFVEKHIDRFGELEDAMYDTSTFVHHSLLSVPLNFGLLTPQEVIAAIEQTTTDINNKEGFIRQVLGWREYMYHWFHYYKEDIYTSNFLDHTKQLPDRFWWPQKSTLKMKCVQDTLEKVETHSYSHHIERLMIIGNFCMLVGYDPHQVNKRFREQYADAFEWVVSPNVLGMSQYADGGKLATKPYIASANYVNKMSNNCKKCFYNPKEKYGEKACPLNYLYRNFVNNNQEAFKKGRQGFILNHLKKLEIEKIQEQSKIFIDNL